MTRRIKGPRTKVPDYYEQGRLLRMLFPQFRPTTWKGHKAWIGRLQPDPGSDIYDVVIVYRGPKAPRVYVVLPDLGKCTHMYKEGHLCLFYPKDPGQRWENDSIIARTIVPWTISWLHFHELYQETDIWQGPEVKHGARDDRKVS